MLTIFFTPSCLSFTLHTAPPQSEALNSLCSAHLIPHLSYLLFVLHTLDCLSSSAAFPLLLCTASSPLCHSAIFHQPVIIIDLVSSYTLLASFVSDTLFLSSTNNPSSTRLSFIQRSD